MVYRTALIGAGSIAGSHLEALRMHPAFAATAIADTVPDRADRLAAAYGLNAYADYRQMVERERPDIVIITLPHYLHCEAAVFCAQRGCHMMLEKPMALDTAECDEITGAVSAAGVKLMVGHTQHYLADNLAAKAVIDEGRLGRLVMINDARHAYYFTPERPAWFFEKAKAGGGMLANIGAHSIDKVQWLGGGRIVQVKASLSHYGSIGDVEGGGLVYAQSEHGVAATISQSGYPGAPRNETELIFTGGMLKLIAGDGVWISEGGPYTRLPLPDEEQAARRDPFGLQLDDLLRYIEDGCEPECSMDYARSVVAVIGAIYRSDMTGMECPVTS